ncbi:MAG: DNA primase [Victivallaceae bacterium]|nr:DNA primase [Victivallaceae bacterium]
MNRAVPEAIVEEIRSRCNIVEVIRSYIPLKKAGGGTWKALCPFHNEKTPSFTVSEARGRYHCFGCGAGGDVFKFIMEWERVDFPNAIHLLASKCGVIVPEKTYSDPREREQAQRRAGRRERLYQINREFAEWYALLLKNNPEWPVSRYLTGRGIPPETAQQFQLGAAPDSWDAAFIHGKELGFTEDELLESGLVLKSEDGGRIYDRFRNRLIFPIWNEPGRVVGFSARTVEAETSGAKYVNSPETPVFKKSNILYALPLARKAIQERNLAILCEGQLDTIALHRAGLECAVAPQGTAFTDEQARILKRYTDRVCLAFDSDAAGKKAAARALELLLPLDFEVKLIRFPDGRDPDEIFRAAGAAGLREIVDDAVGLLDFLCDLIFPVHDRGTPFGKSRIIGETLHYLRKLSNPVAREMYIRDLSSRLGVSPETVFSAYNRETRTRANTFRPAAAPAEIPPAAAPAIIEHAETTLLEIALLSEESAGTLTRRLAAEKLTSSVIGRALNELINCTLNGEWEQARRQLSDFERDHPSPELSRILLRETSCKPGQAAKALEDCLAAIDRHHGKLKRDEIMEKLRSAAPEEKPGLMRQLQELAS